MLLTKDTTIYTLSQEYPFLINALAEHNKTFEKLKNPMLRQTIGRMATIEKAASMGNEGVLELMLFIAGTIMATTGTPIELSPPAVQASGGGTGNLSRERRLTALKEIIRELHDGAELSRLQKKFAQTVGDISPEEIASLEQSLVNEGLPESEIKKMCHLHAALFHNALEGQELPSMPPGHPVHTYMEENAQARAVIAEIKQELDKAGEEAGETVWSFVVGHLRLLAEELAAIQTHYVRKENQLFPLLEQHDLAAPGKVMWEVHDDIRRQLRHAQALLAGKERMAARAALLDLVAAVEDMIHKEERILFPMALQVLTDDDWRRCRLGEEEIGFAFAVTPGSEWTAVGTVSAAANAGLVDLATGQLSPEVVDAMLRNLPVDISFVDADDKVAYYSDSSHRIFPRSPGVIGRDVKNCHPPKSLHMVTEILEAFKRGERKKAEFWLEIGGKFIHIQYLALWDEQGRYLGCLEVGQDATHVRALQGQRRLLEWE
ncbi:protein of unknown function DUF438 [Desulfobulbus propionicus DSM 2032]|uniref:Histidine kinase n=1 Tax=Desulfobulbus propionicus (strain ATCC 33891 / DSM 2032 / VKM B-1956 / 1pr3) TaxID=577650 RepID=A0A7U3YJQ1_DESPD|nr:DUF438 domain-containing protein [Desulfobulbus propionicus]ADW16650.1 protein of unknown function DUF438 [Desulfobulbus propionicus DSM 2032]